jgi:AmmeMemoRadiSam system protein B
MSTAAVRPAAVAGAFYPGNPGVLAADLADYLGSDNSPALRPKALIVPHAGYIYSGPIAGTGCALLRPLAKTIRRVLMFGPAHREWVRGLAAPSSRAFATPLGQVPVDTAAVAAASLLPQVEIDDLAHRQEHCLEVQLPMLQTVLDDFSIVPFVVGGATGSQVAEVMDLLWGGDETLVLVSSDLSHYLPYDVARQMDRATADNVVQGHPLSRHEQACGATPINGLIEMARRRHLAATLLDLRNSGDTAGDKARVVGYGAFAFTEAGDA